ncbi:MAG: hypothetical protein WD266_08120 [Balneolales bacterium]
MQSVDPVRNTSIRIGIILAALIPAIPEPAEAQMTAGDVWGNYEQRQAEHQEAGRVLLTWGTASVLGGGLMMLTDIGDFGLMTAGWGVITTTLAAATLLNPVSFNRREHDLGDLLRYEQRYNRAVALKAGLNTSYIVAGLGMARYGQARRTREYGAAVFAQGSFLLVYHSVLLILSSRYLDKISLYPAHFYGIFPGRSGLNSGGFTLQVQI